MTKTTPVNGRSPLSTTAIIASAFALAGGAGYSGLAINERVAKNEVMLSTLDKRLGRIETKLDQVAELRQLDAQQRDEIAALAEQFRTLLQPRRRR